MQFQSLFTIIPRGQLGNHLHSYALLVSLQKHFKTYHFYLASETWQYLKTYFKIDSLLLPSLDDLCLCKSQNNIYSQPWNWNFIDAPVGSDFLEVCVIRTLFVFGFSELRLEHITTEDALLIKDFFLWLHIFIIKQFYVRFIEILKWHKIEMKHLKNKYLQTKEKSLIKSATSVRNHTTFTLDSN